MKALHVDIALRRGPLGLRVNLEVPPTGVTVLLGPSGGGKSTLLRAIAGLERPREGRIALGAELWFDASERCNLPPQRRRAGMLFQQYALFPHLSVAANIGFGVPRSTRARQTEKWLAALRIEELAGRYPAQLSGGQRQRVALARALASEPPVLLLDEPFSAVDADLRRHLRRLFREVTATSARPVLLVTHDLDDALELADQIGVLVDGSLRRFGPTAEVFREPQEVTVARTLGWQNLLPVQQFVGDRALGPWGSLSLNNAPEPTTRWLGIPPHCLVPNPAGRLGARICRCVVQGDYTRVECELTDGSPCVFHHRGTAQTFAVGEQLHLHVPSEHIRPLTETSTC